MCKKSERPINHSEIIQDEERWAKVLDELIAWIIDFYIIKKSSTVPEKETLAE